MHSMLVRLLRPSDLTSDHQFGVGLERLRNRLVRLLRPLDSSDYWCRRYADGGNSGDGSYSVLAQDKADFINAFVRTNDIQSVIEFGCGDGNQFSLFECPSYLGIDVSTGAIQRCAERHPGHSFITYDPKTWHNRGAIRAELALSLDVIYHLIEDDVYARYMEHLFGVADRYVIIYSSDFEERVDASHVRPRKFTPDQIWILIRAIKVQSQILQLYLGPMEVDI